MLRKFLSLAAITLVTQAASASVLYNWTPVSHDSSMPAGLHLELEFSNAAVAGGSLAFDLVNACSYGDCQQQQSGLLALRYWYGGSSGKERWNAIDYRLGDETLPGYQRISLDLHFLSNGYLSGSLSANDGFSDFAMQSSGNLFTMLAAHSDEPQGCGYAYPSCAGDTGRLRRQSLVQPRDSQVPEPAVPATLAIGALAAWFARRRKPGRKGA